MIIFINGSFGVGKTTVANLLVQQLPNSLVYDPEEVGFMLRSLLSPVEWSGDFQDYSLWRVLVPQIGKLLANQYNRTLIIPMTIWRPDYFAEVIEGLKSFDVNFHHFCLTAPFDTISHRLYARGDRDEASWVYRKAEKCVAAFQSERFEARIDTVGIAPEAIVLQILARVS